MLIEMIIRRRLLYITTGLMETSYIIIRISLFLHQGLVGNQKALNQMLIAMILRRHLLCITTDLIETSQISFGLLLFMHQGLVGDQKYLN